MPRGGAPIFTSPSYVMRFSPQDEYAWGLNVERHISRKQERTHWNLLQKDQPGLVSQFGNLHGIRDIDPPLHLEYVPYTMGRSIVDGGADYFGNAGVDIRYGVTSSLSLNATVNPDFGQVEADPAQLNLTAFVDFFANSGHFLSRGRQFFRPATTTCCILGVSGTDRVIFPCRKTLSKRIGRKPRQF